MQFLLIESFVLVTYPNSDVCVFLHKSKQLSPTMQSPIPPPLPNTLSRKWAKQMLYSSMVATVNSVIIHIRVCIFLSKLVFKKTVVM